MEPLLSIYLSISCFCCNSDCKFLIWIFKDSTLVAVYEAVEDLVFVNATELALIVDMCEVVEAVAFVNATASALLDDLRNKQ